LVVDDVAVVAVLIEERTKEESVSVCAHAHF